MYVPLKDVLMKELVLECTHVGARNESESERWKWNQVGVIDES